jgi:hypothetical protein
MRLAQAGAAIPCALLSAPHLRAGEPSDTIRPSPCSDAERQSWHGTHSRLLPSDAAAVRGCYVPCGRRRAAVRISRARSGGAPLVRARRAMTRLRLGRAWTSALLESSSCLYKSRLEPAGSTSTSTRLAQQTSLFLASPQPNQTSLRRPCRASPPTRSSASAISALPSRLRLSLWATSSAF